MLDFFRSRKERVRRANIRERKALHSKIMDAVHKKNPEELRLLLTSDEVQKSFERIGKGVLFRCLNCAVMGRDSECVEEILKAGAYQCREEFCRPLTRVMYLGEDRLLQLLLKYGESPDSEWELPLFLAVRRAELSMFRTLLLYGADPDHNISKPHSKYVSPYTQSLLGLCLAENYEEAFVKLLIAFGANMYSPEVQRSLNSADNDAAKLLLRAKAHPRPLKSQCRISIRRLLKQVGKLLLIGQLEIPNQLVAYLQYCNELDYPEKLPRYFEVKAQFCCTLGI
ncbi:uncharacterized protein [Engystomops pustulosus]|uniref:uncharacterized protein n=1 Tax=Engystomops pustulosus TaxID=76066 RepID=UPI003AFA4BBE